MSQFISLKEAQQMTALYRQENENILQPAFRNRGILPFTEIFHKQVVETLLNRPGVTGLRIYYGMGPDLRVHAILAGVTADGKPILPDPGVERTDGNEDDYLADRSIRCPDECDKYSDLNP